MSERRPMSEEQKRKLSQAQLAYIARDPRWAEHRRKLAEAQRRPEQRARLSATTRAYRETDPRWPGHCARLREAATRATALSLLPEEIGQILELRRKGRNFEYIAEEFCVSDKIIRRELRSLGIDTGRVKSDRRAKRSKGHWRCFD